MILLYTNTVTINSASFNYHVLISNKCRFYLNSWFCLDYLWLRYSRNYSLLPCLNTCHNLSRLRNEALQKFWFYEGVYFANINQMRISNSKEIRISFSSRKMNRHYAFLILKNIHIYIYIYFDMIIKIVIYINKYFMIEL